MAQRLLTCGVSVKTVKSHRVWWWGARAVVLSLSPSKLPPQLPQLQDGMLTVSTAEHSGKD